MGLELKNTWSNCSGSIFYSILHDKIKSISLNILKFAGLLLTISTASHSQANDDTKKMQLWIKGFGKWFLHAKEGI